MHHALKVLEFDAIVDRLNRFCETSLGAELAAQLSPSFDPEVIDAELNLTLEAYDALGRDAPPSLGAIRDVRMALDRASKGSTLGGEELYQIGGTLQALRNAKVFWIAKRDAAPGLCAFTELFPESSRLAASLLDSLESDGEVRDSASPALASLRKRKLQAASRILEKMQSYVSGKTRDYLSDPLYTSRDGRYVLPVKSEHRAKIRGVIHDTSGTGQTVYVEPEEVIKLSAELKQVEAQEREEVQRILAEFSVAVGAVAGETIPAIADAAELDLRLAKAKLAYDMQALAPKKGRPGSLKLDGARHPLLDANAVVPLTIEVGLGFNGLLITGPNTGGKTVAIKCAGLCVLMAQSGLFVPARDAEFGPFTQVWADIGDEQSLSQSLSTFSGHIKNMAAALDGAKPNALALFDELGAGTDPAEGAALAQAILRELNARGVKVIASTHYGELKAFAFSEPGFLNAAMEFDSKSLKPTYRLMMGAPGASHAMKIAERYGISRKVIESAKACMESGRQDVAEMLERLESSQKLARQAQGEADRRAHELKLAEDRASKKLAEADAIRRKVNESATEAIESTLREIRLQAAEIFEALKKSSAPQAEIESARANLKALQSLGEESAKRYQTPKAPPRTDSTPQLAKGSRVRVEGYSMIGELVESPAGGKALVQLGPLKMTIPLAKMSLVEEPQAKERSRALSTMQTQRAATSRTEVSLRGMRAEDAMHDLESFVDEAILGGLHQVRIVHGKGEGILRKMVHDYLRRRKEVDGYRLGEPGEGGDGVTIAGLK